MILDMRKRKGIGSDLEDDFHKQMEEAGISGYRRNVQFITGRRFLADFWFEDLKLVVEVDGGLWQNNTGHTSGKGSHSDRERDAVAYIVDGTITLRIGTNHVKSGEGLKWVQQTIERRKDELSVRERDMLPVSGSK